MTIELKVPKETKSDRIRKLYTEGMSIPKIAKTVGICYAFAYQVIQRDRAKEGLAMDTLTEHEEPKGLKIIELRKKGLTKGAIAHELNTNYVFVWKTVHDWELRNPEEGAAAKELEAELKATAKESEADEADEDEADEEV